MREEIANFCAHIGKNPLQVQGAGGNVSWKEKHALHIKASGTWLAHAKDKDIFLPVDLMQLQSSIKQKAFLITPSILSSSNMRPSIETMLHAIMPQKIVVHLHLVNAIAWLVRKKCSVKHLANGNFNYTLVDYYKPGSPLAEAVHSKIKNCPETNVVFLKNHGVIVGGDSIDTISRTIKKIDEIFFQESRAEVDIPDITPLDNEYLPIPCQKIQQLAFDKDLFQRLSKDWALYPDHVVFLGSRPHIHHGDNMAEIIFLKNRGVFAKTVPSPAEIEQLLCYYNVLTRQHPEEELVSLSSQQIAAVLNWDAERYRQTL